MFGGRLGLGVGPSGGAQIPAEALPVPTAYMVGTHTTTVTNPDTGEKTTVTLGGTTPEYCNSIPDHVSGPDVNGSAQNCCKAISGYWYQDYGIFAPLFPDKSGEYCHDAPPTFFQIPMNQELVIGGTIASIVIASVAGYVLLKKRKG